MNIRDSNGHVPWPLVTVAGGLLVTCVGGSIWLGALSNQIAVNTGRLTRIETLMDEVRQHDADTTARLKPIENRLDRLELWQTRVKQGLPPGG